MNKDKPLYGYGTHRLKGELCYKSVLYALRQGYNLIDTAEKYFNGAEIGRAIKASGRKRSSIKIVHKLTDVLDFPRTHNATVDKVEQYLKELDVQYIDILLMHGPSPRYHENPEIFIDGNIEVWNSMIEMKELKLLNAIGVSNFHKHQIMYLIEATGVVPDYLEIQYNPINYKEMLELKQWCDNMGIRVIGYSPLAEGNIEQIAKTNEYHEVRTEYGQKHEYIKPDEFALRFCLTHNVIPIPRSSNTRRIKSNLKCLKKGKL